MISSVEEYEYVIGADVDEAHPHGDLDRIVIDGEIMPKRKGVTGKKDKDGNAIPRENILRGEDVAFLMEAVMQRTGRNWLVAYWTYSWRNRGVGSAGYPIWEKQMEKFDGDEIEQMTFSRKITVGNYRGGSGASNEKKILDRLGDVCDNCIGGLLSASDAKVFEFGKDDMPSDFNEAFGFSGLPDGMRPYKPYDGLKREDPLDKQLVYACFMTVSLCKCAYLGYVAYSAPLHAVDYKGNPIEGYPTDFAICGSEGEGVSSGTYMRWGAYTRKWSEWEIREDGPNELTWHSGTCYSAPKSDFTFVNFKARHVANAVAVAALNVQFEQSKENGDGTAEIDSWQKMIWLPVALAKSGEFFILKSDGNFSSEDNVKSILSRCGWSKPSIPSGEHRFSSSATITLTYMDVLGEWDDHTSLDA